MKILTKTNDLTHDEWLAYRQQGIGGSDSSVIVGLNPYKSLFTLYADKKGLLPPIEDNEPMRLGRDLEDYVAKRFTEETGKKVYRRNMMFQHEQHDFILANVDRMIVGENAGLECKTTSVLNLKKFKNGEFPDTYYTQCVHYMAVTGADKWYLAVLVLGVGFKWFTIERDESEIDALINAEVNFWNNYIVTNTPPNVDGEKSTTETLNTIYADTIEESINIDETNFVNCIISMEKQIKELEKIVDTSKQELKSIMGNHKLAFCDKYKITWKPTPRTTFDVKKYASDNPGIDLSKYYKTSKSRTFKITENKEK